MNVFFCENADHSGVVFNEEESRHAVQVLRLRAGDAIQVTDGKGKFCKAEIVVADAKKCEVKLFECINNFKKRNYVLHIAIAPTKQMERFEWFIEKAVELGIDEITPLICHDSVRTKIRTARIEKVMLTALKQSVQAYIPQLNEAATFYDFINKDFDCIKMIAYCNEENQKHVEDLISGNQNMVILIGPEGDFTGGEISSALQKGFSPVSLGESRLRTETAGVYICSAMRMINKTNNSID